MVDFSRAQGASLWALSFWSQPVRGTLRPRERDWGSGMKLRGLMALGSLSCLLALPAAGQSRRVDLEAADCSEMHVQFGDLEVARAVQHGSVPLSAGRLDVEPEANGGVSFEKGTGSSYSITACIAAGGATQTEAQQAADSVRLSIEGSRVRVQGVLERKGRAFSSSSEPLPERTCGPRRPTDRSVCGM